MRYKVIKGQEYRLVEFGFYYERTGWYYDFENMFSLEVDIDDYNKINLFVYSGEKQSIEVLTSDLLYELYDLITKLLEAKILEEVEDE